MRNGAFGMLGWNNLGTGNTTYQNLYFINAEWNTYKRNSGILGSMLNQGVNLSGNVVENIYAETPTNMLANARLIAAAPDLYEALEAFLGLNRWQAPRTGGALPTDDEIDEIVAISLGMEAINKARGGVQ